MKTTRLIALSIVLMFMTFSAFNVSAYTKVSKGYEVEFEQTRDNEFQLTFDLGKYQFENTNKNGVDYTKIVFNGSVKTNKQGWAELPYLSAAVQLSPDKNVTVSVADQQYIEYSLDDPLLPSRGIIYRNQDPSLIPYEVDPLSLTDQWYPAELTDASEPFILRDVRGENIYVYPFLYNAAQNKVRVYTNVTLRVRENDTEAINPLTDQSPVTREMASVYPSIFVNYNQNPVRWTEEIGNYGQILVIYTSRDATAIQPWITWKKEMGYIVNELQVSTGTNVVANIASEYGANKEILYVLLVGDWADIQTDLGPASAPTDPMAGCVAGADDFHDLIIGRFSANADADVTIQGNKVITYERDPDIGGLWYTNGLGIGSDEGAGIGDDGEVDMDHIDIIKENRLVPFTYSGNITEAYGGSVSVSTVANAINSGISIINYCGHGSHDIFVTSGYSTSDAASSTNGNKLPFVFSVACVNGEYHTGSDCLAEAMLKKDGGGAIATLMSTINQPWTPPMRGQDYANDLLIQGYDYSANPGNGTSTTYGKTTFGGIAFNATAMMITESNGTDDWDTYKTWCIFGDPSVQVRTATPKAINVVNQNVSPGSYLTQIQVDGAPFENALVSLYQTGAGQPSAGLTDASGNVTINHTFTGTVKLTVTGYNLATFQFETVVQTPDPPVCSFVADQTIVTEGTTVNFTDNSINYPSQWEWTFDGGSPLSSSAQNPSVAYNTAGTYDVSLKVTNSAGNDSLIIAGYILVEPVSTPPVTDFAASATTIFAGETLDFTDLSTNLPDSWLWTFEGSTNPSSTDQNPTAVLYEVAGTYDVTLEATNIFGTDTETKIAYITVNPPEYCAAGASTEYEYIESVELGSILNTSDWSSGGYEDYTSLSTQMDIGTPYSLTVSIGSVYGSDQVLVWVDWNIDGDFDDTDEDVFVASNLGQSSYTIPITPPANAQSGNARIRIRLHDTNTGESPNDTPCGNSGYGEVEDYTIVIPEYVPSQPIADFIASTTSIYVGESVDFTSLSSGLPDTYSWSFEGGSPPASADQNPMGIAYNSPGLFQVELTVTNDEGTDTKTEDLYIEVTSAPVTLVYWDFPNDPDDIISDGGIPENDGTKFISDFGGLTNVAHDAVGATTQAAKANGWDSGMDTKGWKVTFESTGYEALRLSSKQLGVSRSPLNFKVQYSLDGIAWTDVPNMDITIATDWTTGVIDNVSLPAECNNQANVQLRWIMSSNDGIFGNILSSRDSRIDDIIVIGSPMSGLGCKEVNSLSSIVSLFPNPNNGNFSIKINDSFNGTLNILDISGQQIYSEVLSSVNERNVNLSRIAKGVYILQLISDKNTHLERFIVK